jgi:hypothetical protein
LYPNEKLRLVGSDAAERDIEKCSRDAQRHVSSGSRGEEIAGSAAISSGTSAAVGAAGGAAGGAVVGRAGRGAAVGAAGGAAGGLVSGLFRGLFRSSKPSPVYKNFVNHCLREKGYQPIGWN